MFGKSFRSKNRTEKERKRRERTKKLAKAEKAVEQMLASVKLGTLPKEKEQKQVCRSQKRFCDTMVEEKEELSNYIMDWGGVEGLSKSKSMSRIHQWKNKKKDIPNPRVFAKKI